MAFGRAARNADGDRCDHGLLGKQYGVRRFASTPDVLGGITQSTSTTFMFCDSSQARSFGTSG